MKKPTGKLGPQEVVVAHCTSGCPFIGDGFTCHHPVLSEVKPLGNEERLPPTWCPLRKRPALVRLRGEQ